MTTPGKNQITLEYMGFSDSFDIFVLPQENEFVYGDISGDGNYSIVDAKLLLEGISSGNLNNEQKTICDLSGDGNVSILDAKLLLHRISYKIDS